MPPPAHIPKRLARLAWVFLCLALGTLLVAQKIPVNPPLPSATLHDDTRLVVEAVNTSTTADFTPPTRFSQTWLGRASSGLRATFGPFDTTPLNDSADPALAPEPRPPFADPALWVWISLRDPKTGKYRETPPPRLTAELADERNTKLHAGKPIAARHPDGRPVFGFYWPHFHRPTRTFLLSFSQFIGSAGCTFEIPNPEVSMRQMPWAKNASSTPPEQTVGELKIKLTIADNSGNPHMARHYGLLRFGAKATHRETGKDVAIDYGHVFYTDAWGISSNRLPRDFAKNPIRVRLFVDEPGDKENLPDSQKYSLVHLREPKAGEIIPINHAFGPPENPVRILACLGPGVYHKDKSTEKIRTVRPLNDAELERYERFTWVFQSTNELFIKDVNGLPCIELPAKTEDEFVIHSPSLLLHRQHKYGALRGTVFSQNFFIPSGYQRLPVEFKDGRVKELAPSWELRNYNAKRTETFYAPKVHEVNFFYKP